MKQRLKSAKIIVEALGLICVYLWSVVLAVVVLISLFAKDYPAAERHATLAIAMWLFGRGVQDMDRDTSVN